MKFRIVINRSENVVRNYAHYGATTERAGGGYTKIMIPHSPAKLKLIYADLTKAFPTASIYVSRIWDCGRIDMINTNYLKM
jgi:hypothetical protein